MSTPVRVRFAPSPTGPLHIGGVRTALFNYLFAKGKNGKFILRIEDTDQNRYVEGAEDYIIESLNWCGITIDEGPREGGDKGPYRQSERKEIYRKYAEMLVEKGHAYYAFDTAEELDTRRQEAESLGNTFIYNWYNRDHLNNSLGMDQETLKGKLENSDNYVIRFKAPKDETLVLKDRIRGEITIDTNILDDKVLFKSDGMPTYHLANIVDDHLMEISHVIRGEEWLPSLALHVLLYRSFGWQAPEFAHLPLILKPAGKGKLSKRDGDKLGFPVFPLEWKDPKDGTVSAGYREEGYFPEAVVNFLALLGWNPGDEREIFGMEELCDVFTLEKVNKSGARFDPDKIKWFNHHYLQQASVSELVDRFQKVLKSNRIEVSDDFAEKVIVLIRERADFVGDFLELGGFFFETPQTYDEKAARKQWKEDTNRYINEIGDLLAGLPEFSSEISESVVKQWITDNELGFGKVMPPLRLALVGEMKGPHIFDIMGVIGQEETVARLRRAVEVLG
ncbi:glutamate--tRNA ligase [Robertkochia aurantiaca]|uniref:glutamate--tRNA ligase n=1 Tax=Robertkochia aurantiaca TaxID=2873700 RepID=UPI001CCFFE68|nr:glutamate--tRNA ligase [Robertkochia sp. 3YJGBD-33]